MRLQNDPDMLAGIVSIHASVKDATHLVVRIIRIGFCFNPRICKRCDTANFDICHRCTVSIHASVKDATTFASICVYPFTVSIHASVKDATVLVRQLLILQSFNPRICKRCDMIRCTHSEGSALFQSTHL